MVRYQDLHWHSDWNGYEIGYPDVDVVGLYEMISQPIQIYLNIDTMEVLDLWFIDNEADEIVEDIFIEKIDPLKEDRNLWVNTVTVLNNAINLYNERENKKSPSSIEQFLQIMANSPIELTFRNNDK